MKFIRTAIPDVIICAPKIVEDERGYFFESFRQDKLEAFLGFSLNFCQDNESKSSFGVLRGLHYQLPPYSQTKLVRVTEGRILDIVVDIRKDSPTFGKHVSVALDAESKKQLFVPKGFAHGFAVLSEFAVFTYKVDNYYSPDCDRGIAYNDAELNIDWKLPVDKIQLSPKDLNQPAFSEAEYFESKINLYKK